jgi:hypothetical protein
MGTSGNRIFTRKDRIMSKLEWDKQDGYQFEVFRDDVDSSDDKNAALSSLDRGAGSLK